MWTLEKPEACARAWLVAVFALGCGQDPSAPAQADPDPGTAADESPAPDTSADILDPASPVNAPANTDPLPDAGQTQASELPVHSRAFLNFPEHAADAAQAPQLLSATGAFTNLATLEASPGILPYGVRTPLWSDGAYKRRWLSLPEGGKIGFSATGQWSFPEGTVFVKQFAMALDERQPDQLQRLETRFWIAARDGEFYGLVYKWDDDQQDAQLLLSGASEELSIAGTDGIQRTQTYTYPAAAACKSCHSAAAGAVRGVRTLQLNGNFEYGAAYDTNAAAANQLAVLDGLGMFDGPIGDPAQYGHLSAIDDESAPLEERVRSYWDSNCSMCHNESPSSPSWDARYTTALADQKVLMTVPLSGPGDDDLRLIVPQEPDRSYLLLRVDSDQPGVRMPPVLRNRIDEAYVAVLRSWILALPKQ
jgi:uncharacterized repeat protein (TIGR03806 family)